MIWSKKHDDAVANAETGLPDPGPVALAFEGGAGAATGTPPLSPETLRQLAEMRDRVQSTVGRLVLALGGVSRYSHQTFADVQTLIMEPLIRERIVIASQRPDNGTNNPEATPIVAIAFWASVSDAVDANIRAQIASGVCPVRLRPDDWTSGTTIWLLDLVAPSKEVASTMLANFAKTVQPPQQINLHPAVSAQVDPALVSKAS